MEMTTVVIREKEIQIRGWKALFCPKIRMGACWSCYNESSCFCFTIFRYIFYLMWCLCLNKCDCVFMCVFPYSADYWSGIPYSITSLLADLVDIYVDSNVTSSSSFFPSFLIVYTNKIFLYYSLPVEYLIRIMKSWRSNVVGDQLYPSISTWTCNLVCGH